MSWKKIRLPILSILLITLLGILMFSSNLGLHSQPQKDSDPIQPEVLSNQISNPNPTTTVKSIYKPTSSPKAIHTSTPNTNTVSNGSSNNDSGNSNNTTVSASNTTSATPTPTVATQSPTLQPTSTPTTEMANIQIWVRGWQYVNNQQYAADGNVKIKKGGQEIASGSVNGDIVYKASNMPTNSNLEIYFYLPNGCGQVKQITTGNNSSLHQEDFNFSSGTTCL